MKDDSYTLLPHEQKIADQFHELYYDKRVGPGQHRIWEQTHWMGVPVLKSPLDLWIYQELVHEVKPDLVVETGTYASGTTLFLAHMLDIIGHGTVVSIDVAERVIRAKHPRINYLLGSSVDPGIVESVRRLHSPSSTCMVILDSDHSKEHVMKELNVFASLVSVGSYLVVEDTNVNGHPVYPTFGEGPYEAVQEFLKNDSRFVVDRSKEKFLASWNPCGFLKRIA